MMSCFGLQNIMYEVRNLTVEKDVTFHLLCFLPSLNNVNGTVLFKFFQRFTFLLL